MVMIGDDSNKVLTDWETGTELALSSNVIEVFQGSSGNDILNGTEGNDIIEGLDGNDVLIGKGGDDTLNGGNGIDRIKETADTDFILTDTQLIGNGTDQLISIERATLIGGAGDNIIDASAFTLSGVSLRGEAGHDLLIGTINNDTLSGGFGFDTLDGGEGIDWLQERGDFDFIILYDDLLILENSNGVFGLHSFQNIERARLTGGKSDNYIDASFFSKGPVNLSGKEGMDGLVGTVHNDTLSGGKDDDTLDGGDGIDLLRETADVDFTLTNSKLTGNGNDDLYSIERATLTGGKSDNRLDASAFVGTVTLNGKAGNDTLIGGTDNDRLIGGDGDDALIGGAGNDTLSGGTGNNFLDGGEGIDWLQETGDFNFFFYDDGLLYVESLDGGVSAIHSLQNIERVRLTGGESDNIIDASLVSNTPVSMNGKAGNDTLIGGTSHDRLIGGDGNDQLVGGAGNDTLTGGSGGDRFDFSSPNQGIDRITDFSVSEDLIGISAQGFANGGLTANAVISADQFYIGTGATDADHRFIYNQNNGALFFDADGTGTTSQIQIATLSKGLAMTHANIFVI